MDSRSRALFLALILAQAAHSVEECVFRLYDVFAPARFVSGLVSHDLRTGFIVANVALVSLGLWSWFARVRVGHPSARGWAWGWTLLELANGVVHPSVAFLRRGYFPGTVTAVALLLLSFALAGRLLRSRREAEPLTNAQR